MNYVTWKKVCFWCFLFYGNDIIYVIIFYSGKLHPPYALSSLQPKHSIQPSFQAEIENKENCSLQSNTGTVVKDHNYASKDVVSVPSVVQPADVKSQGRAQVYIYLIISLLH